MSGYVIAFGEIWQISLSQPAHYYYSILLMKILYTFQEKITPIFVASYTKITIHEFFLKKDLQSFQDFVIM